MASRLQSETVTRRSSHETIFRSPASGHQFRGCATKLDFGRRNFVASCHEIHAEDGVLPSVFTPVFACRFL